MPTELDTARDAQAVREADLFDPVTMACRQHGIVECGRCRSTLSRGNRTERRRKATTGECLKCGRRLVKRVVHGRVSNLHEHNGQIRCDPPPPDKCAECERVGLVQCGTVGCDRMIHPGGSCSRVCTCCQREHCSEHAGLDGLCHSCAATEHQHDEDAW